MSISEFYDFSMIIFLTDPKFNDFSIIFTNLTLWEPCIKGKQPGRTSLGRPRCKSYVDHHFLIRNGQMILKVKVNDLHFQYQMRVSQDACLVQIWWF